MVDREQDGRCYQQPRARLTITHSVSAGTVLASVIRSRLGLPPLGLLGERSDENIRRVFETFSETASKEATRHPGEESGREAELEAT